MGDRTDTPQSPSGHASLLGEDADMDVDADGLTGWDGFDKDEHATVRDAAGANEAVAGPMAPRPIACDITQMNGFPSKFSEQIGQYRLLTWNAMQLLRHHPAQAALER